MGKKKQATANVAVGTTLPPSLYKQLEKLVEQSPGETISSLVRNLIADRLAIEAKTKSKNDKRTATNRDAELSEESLLRLLTHFEERLAERIVHLNYNLRQATGLILTPKPSPTEEPPSEFAINNSRDAKDWVESRFRKVDL